MACIDREKFAYAVAARLDAIEISGPRAAASAFGVAPACWTRIASGGIISADNFAAVCKALDLDAREFVDMGAANPHSQSGRPGFRQWPLSAGPAASARNTA